MEISGATPHVTGLAALILGYYKPTGLHLVQEDIEYIIQTSATDVGAVGYDAETGHGRINAGAALEMIKRPMCNIYHFGTDVNPHTKSTELVEADFTLELTEPYTTESGQTFDRGTYTADVFKVSTTVDHPFPANHAINHYWERHSSSSVFRLYDSSGSQNELQPVEIVEITNVPSSSSTMLEGYIYYLKNNSCSVEGWIPASPANTELTYSVIGCWITDTKEITANSLQIYPNPAFDQIEISLANNDISSVSIYDFSGRRMHTTSSRFPDNQSDMITFDINHFPPGIYTCVLNSEEKLFTSKFIKL